MVYTNGLSWGTDVPNLDPNAIRENINKVFDYVRPILSVGGVAFDVYDYLATNGKPDLLSVSGSYQAGFSIKVPVVLSDKGPRSILAEGSYLHISDGAEDGNLNIGSYLGVLEISAPEPVLDVLFYLNGGSFHALSLDDLENQTTSISGGFSTVDIPLLDGMAGQVSSVKLETTIDTGSSVYGIYEWSFMGVDVPDIDANAVREDINNIFDYVRPILSFWRYYY